MRLEKIEIQGFKSFAQKTELFFPLTASATATCGTACIVGPNGSGKSNIVDAIRWVLGEQSLKSLRGRKSEDVIFSGSEKKGKLGLASVALHIDNSDGVMPVDYKEVVISRKLYRNGESEYRVNKSRVRLQDILLLVAKANFGQKSYSIVSQGSIDQVIMASPADRKDYFDEAVGVKQFQLKRDSSINKLESAWNNLLQVDALLTEIKPRLNSLTRQVNRLQRREKTEANLRELQKKYYGFLWAELQTKAGQIKPKLTAAETVLKEKEHSLQEVQKELRQLEQQETSSSAFSSLQDKYQKLLEQKNKLREEQLMLQNKIELATQRQTERAVPLPLPDIIKKLKAIDALEEAIVKNLESGRAEQLAQVKADAKELAGLIRELINQLENPKIKEQIKAVIDPTLVADLQAAEKDIAGMDSQIEAAKKELQQFNQKEEKQKGTFFDLQRRYAKVQSEYNQYSSTASDLRVEMARLETRQQDLRTEIKDELAEVAWLKNVKVETINGDQTKVEISKLKHQLELIGGVEPEVVEEHTKVKERHDFLSEQADDLRHSIKQLEKVITDLDEKIQEQFDSAFKHISREFTKFFKVLFDGGKAELILIKEDPTEQQATQKAKLEVDSVIDQSAEPVGEIATPSILDQLQAAEKQLSPKTFLKKRTGKVITGIEIVATPPGKKVSSINMLSGGERSLASIALICAIISNNPSPFVVLDEVDAALDEANSQRFAKIVDELAHKTQFIVITHNRATMQVASILYGVTMGSDGVSKLISLKLEEAEKVVRQ
ncbi:MAG: hypothetical protein A2840_00005 [Candidatus Buchananbacteria bacterium RIFCSPHIGHO2_01_FULL_47_11b]|uniref:RecF/RecN/SMC N-terminal domain-containing protein n=1 Tax=Candidatus Buchananbacteria bacterium RIFCSPHIGHO2_01_FULL_47_11b TaxID=1797537 RepID=A0A1G1Y3E6_9BACT|nr:MAG: hypothetical protein A2840_00005 [Candidatus Buchananbacteria bacterium RIFCSPHIGHO2_01_FULL_47_11b]